MRAVLDANVIISGLISATGAPAALLRALGAGGFEAIVSPKLLDELARALRYPKLRRWISDEDVEAVLEWLGASATHAPDPERPSRVRSEDAGDDYLIALAASERVALVSGDKHLLALEREIPVFSPRAFLELLRGT